MKWIRKTDAKRKSVFLCSDWIQLVVMLHERRSVTYAYGCVAASFFPLYFQLNRKNYTLWFCNFNIWGKSLPHSSLTKGTWNWMCQIVCFSYCVKCSFSLNGLWVSFAIFQLNWIWIRKQLQAGECEGWGKIGHYWNGLLEIAMVWYARRTDFQHKLPNK